MQVLMLAIVMVIAGAAAFVIGPSVAGAQNRGKARLIGIGLMLGGAALAAGKPVVLVEGGAVAPEDILFVPSELLGEVGRHERRG